MNLQEFIANAQNFFKKVDAHFADEGWKAKYEKSELDAKATLDKHSAAIAEKDKEILGLKAQIETLQKDAASAGKRAAEIVASQGIPAVPASTETKPSGDAAASTSVDIVAQLEAITDPAAKVTFVQQHEKELWAASHKK